MNRIEFINILRSTLEVEMPAHKIDEHVKYYDDYIRSAGNNASQEQLVETIGDPRLIAQTIIQSYKMSNEYKYTGQGKYTSYSSSKGQDVYEEKNNTSQSSNRDGSMVDKIKRIAIIVVVIVGLLIILKFVANVFFTIGIPIVLIYFLVKIIIRIFKQ